MSYSGAQWVGNKAEQWGHCEIHWAGASSQQGQQWGAVCQQQWPGCQQPWGSAAGAWPLHCWQQSQSLGSQGGCHVLNLDQFSDASDSDDDEAQPRKKECPLPAPALRAAAPAEPAAEPSPSWLLEADKTSDRSTDDSATEADGSESAELCSLSAGEPEPEVVSLDTALEVQPIPVRELLRLRQAGGGESPRGTSHISGALVASEPPARPSEPPRLPPLQPACFGAGRKGAGAPARRSRPQPVAPRPQPAAQGSLSASEGSWAAQQRARRSEASGSVASEVERKLKSILNKLTLTNFDSLCQQLLDCGVWAAAHLELLIGELFEKATTQHHFIDMYANLCVALNDHFTANPPVGADSRFNFKRLLLSACQASFERHLAPPEGLDQLSGDERTNAEVRYKTMMLGNIRFVGALLVKGLLASKVLLAIVAELLSSPTREALEALAALLVVVGPSFDMDEWVHSDKLDAVFAEMKAIASRPSCDMRSRCLLKDVLDMRKQGWKDHRPKQLEAPTSTETSKCKRTAASALRLSNTPKASAPAQAKRLTVLVKPAAQGSSAEFRAELSKALAELQCSGDGQEAATRIAQQAPPPATSQPEELCHMLSLICQESHGVNRKVGFRAAAGLFTDGRWSPAAASRGLYAFVELCEDLQHDVPTLSSILEEELRPAFAPLLRRGMLEEGALAALPGR